MARREALVVGVDIGTSSTKAVVFDGEGKVRGHHAVGYPLRTPIHPMSPLAKLVWLRHERPDLFERADRFVGIKEYVFFRLFGRWVVDHSIASATGLFNLRKLGWDEGALGIAGITAARLSEPVPPTYHLEGSISRSRPTWGSRPTCLS